MPRPVGRVAKRLRRVRVGFRYHDTLGHGRPFGWKFRGVHTGLHFRLAHSFVGLGFCTSVAHPLARPSGRLRRGSLRKAFAFLRCISAQPAFLSACRFLCRTDSFHFSSAELCLAHHDPSMDSRGPSPQITGTAPRIQCPVPDGRDVWVIPCRSLWRPCRRSASAWRRGRRRLPT